MVWAPRYLCKSNAWVLGPWVLEAELQGGVSLKPVSPKVSGEEGEVDNRNSSRMCFRNGMHVLNSVLASVVMASGAERTLDCSVLPLLGLL